MTKDQLIQYLRVCADLADSPKDGIADVAIVPLRLAVELLEGAPEPPPTKEKIYAAALLKIATKVATARELIEIANVALDEAERLPVEPPLANEVTRYEFVEDSLDDRNPYPAPVADPDGEWVRYDDIKHLLQAEPGGVIPSVHAAPVQSQRAHYGSDDSFEAALKQCGEIMHAAIHEPPAPQCQGCTQGWRQTMDGPDHFHVTPGGAVVACTALNRQAEPTSTPGLCDICGVRANEKNVCPKCDAPVTPFTENRQAEPPADDADLKPEAMAKCTCTTIMDSPHGGWTAQCERCRKVQAHVTQLNRPAEPV